MLVDILTSHGVGHWCFVGKKIKGFLLEYSLIPSYKGNTRQSYFITRPLTCSISIFCAYSSCKISTFRHTLGFIQTRCDKKEELLVIEMQATHL